MSSEAMTAAPRGRWWLPVLLAGASACGGGDDDAPADADAAVVIDAAVGQPDADLSNGIEITVFDYGVGDDELAPVVGAVALQHDRDGALLARKQTDANGRAVFPGAPSMLTLLYTDYDTPTIHTVTEVDAGDSIVILPDPGSPYVGTANVVPPGVFAGAQRYRYAMGWCDRLTTSGVEPFTQSVNECAIAQDGSHRALALAFDDTGEPIAHSLFEAPAFATDVTFPAWSTDFGAVAVTFLNAPAALETNAQFASKDVFFPIAPSRTGSDVSLPYPSPVSDGMQIGAGAATPTEYVQFARSQMSVPAAVTIDFADVLPPAFASISADLSAPARPAVSWQLAAGEVPGTCLVRLRSDDLVWRAIAPGASAATIALPDIPEDLVVYRPTASTLFYPAQVWCYTATFFEHYWDEIDPDFWPDDGDWELRMRAGVEP